MKKKAFLASIVLMFCLLPVVLCADERASLRFITAHNPVPAIKTGQPSADVFYQTNEVKIIGTVLLRFYQLFISTQDVPSCPFHPTCSDYARQAIQEYGLFLGMIMASDRLQRCNGYGSRYYPVEPETGRLFDPPMRNMP